MSHPREDKGRRRRATRLLALLLVVLLGAWLWGRGAEEAPEPGAAAPPRIQSHTQPLPFPPRPPEPLPAGAEPGGLWLQATLEGARPGRAFAGRAWVGPALLGEEDREAWEEMRREGRGGPGPERLEDLANVREWLPAEVAPEEAGGGRLGPVEVPAAPRYRLLAWEPEGTLYWGDYLPEAVPGEGRLEAGVLRARPATGLRVRLRGAPVGRTRYLARLERVVDEASAERASELLPAVRLVAPVLAHALQEEGEVPLEVGEDNLLLPLLPDSAVRLRLRTEAGLEGEPLEVPLREGRVETVEVDVERLFPGGGESFVHLRGRLLLGDTGRPPERVRVERAESPGEAVEPAPEGSFEFERLPGWKPSRFVAVVERAEAGRPVAPERWAFDFTPGPGPHERPVEETWRVPAYRWVVLKLDAFARGQLESRARRPYPVYMLQRRDEAGRWRTERADEFLPEEGGVAVSVRRAGTYRVLAAASAYEVYESPEVALGEGDTEGAVSLSVAGDAVPCEVRVTSGAGLPVYGARVTVAGEHGSLPPVRGRTDAEGRWRLGHVRGGALYLEVEHEGPTPWTGQPVEDCRRTGRVEVRL